MCRGRPTGKDKGMYELYQVRPGGEAIKEQVSTLLKPLHNQHISNLLDGTHNFLNLFIVFHLNGKK